MTISAKLSDVAGLEYVVSDPTDTDDVGGFSDAIITGAETCKYSDSSIIQAGSGKKIGVSQIKFATALNPRTRSTIPTTSITDPANVIDDDLLTFGSTSGTGIVVTVDFGIIDTAVIKCKVRHLGSAISRSALEISTNNSVWTEVSNIQTAADTTFTHDGGTQTYRYARLNVITNGFGTMQCHEIFEEPSGTTALIRIRSSASQDTANGTIIKDNVTITNNVVTTLDTELFLVESSQYLTFEIISFANGIFQINATEITTVTET